MGAGEATPLVALKNNSPEVTLRGIEFPSPSLLAMGGPDAYGYQWDDAVAYNWKEVAGATPVVFTGSGDDGFAGPIPLGFNFPYYEHTYAELYISMNGYVSFATMEPFAGGDAENRDIPYEFEPNDLIAPYWSDLAVGGNYNNGVVSTMSGSDGNGTYLAINYVGVSESVISSPDLLTFQIILYQNGDIWFQYNQLAGDLTPTIGIEDSDGLDGLQYPAAPQEGLALRFQRPAASARVKFLSTAESGLTESGTREFILQIRNTGQLGADTYNLIPVEIEASSANWQMSFWTADGSAELTDTNSDGVVDTGSMPQGSTFTLSARIHTSEITAVGTYATFMLQATSLQDATQSDEVKLLATVPTGHFIAFGNSAGLDIGRVTTDRQIVFDVAGFGSNPALLRVGNKYFYAWQYRYSQINPGTDIEYAILNKDGVLIQSATKLTSNEAAPFQPRDFSPAIAQAPDGRVGVVWVRELFDPPRGWNYEVYYAILNASGEVLIAPTNVTNNGPCDPNPTLCWHNGVNLNVPVFSSPAILATEDNRFVLVWIDRRISPGGILTDIGTAIFDTAGNNLLAADELTSGTVGAARFEAVRLLPLPNQRMLVAYHSFDPVSLKTIPTYGVFSTAEDTPGFEIQENILMTGVEGRNYDLVALNSSNILWAWTDPVTNQIQYTLLTDQGLLVQKSNQYIFLPTPDARMANFVSVAVTTAGHGILSWVDAEIGNRVYYALIDANGTILSPPVTAWQDNQTIVVSQTGQGIVAFTAGGPQWDGDLHLPIIQR
jgi:hypothetical protein